MIIPFIIICPICEKRIYLRIQNGGYLYEYPIRFHCINCHALIKGTFIMDSSIGKKGLNIFNAKTEDCIVHLGSEKEIDADYIAEVSGELPCQKISEFDGKTKSTTPFLEATDHIVNMKSRISELEQYTSKMEEWKKWKSIAFQLLSEDELEYIPIAIRNKMGKYTYECSDYLKSLHCLQEVVREETNHIFTNESQDNSIEQLISTLSDINHTALHEFVTRAGGISELKAAYKKVIEAFTSFMDIYPNILPAETYLHYKNRNDPRLGIATCSFTDIKYFYLDSYETLLSLLQYAVCLDNILLRGDFLNYNQVYSDFYNNSKQHIKNRYINNKIHDDYERFLNLDNGKRLELMGQSCEKIQSILNIPVKASVRNAISHNTYKYDGLGQIITIYDQKNPEKIKMTISLLDMAIDCLHIVKSIVLFSEMILFIMRQEEQQYHSIIHPRFYKNPERNEPCPCGSTKKYKNCCMNEIETLHIHQY